MWEVLLNEKSEVAKTNLYGDVTVSKALLLRQKLARLPRLV